MQASWANIDRNGVPMLIGCSSYLSFVNKRAIHYFFRCKGSGLQGKGRGF